jgi:hypothetical protein
MQISPYRFWALFVALLLALGITGRPSRLLAARPAFDRLPSDNPTQTALDKSVDKAVREFFQQDQHIGLSIAISDHGHSVFYNYGTVNKSKVRLPEK